MIDKLVYMITSVMATMFWMLVIIGLLFPENGFVRVNF